MTEPDLDEEMEHVAKQVRVVHEDLDFQKQTKRHSHNMEGANPRSQKPDNVSEPVGEMKQAWSDGRVGVVKTLKAFIGLPRTFNLGAVLLSVRKRQRYILGKPGRSGSRPWIPEAHRPASARVGSRLV